MLRIATAGLASGEHVLSAEGAHYVQRVHRSSEGDQVLLFDPDSGVEAPAVITKLSHKAVVCRVGEVLPGRRRGIDGLRLIQGLGKGDKAEQVVKHAVALGVQSVEFVTCERSVSRPSARDADKELRLQRVAVDVARQCGRSNVPSLGMNVAFRVALEKAKSEGLLVALHTDGSSGVLERILEDAMPSVVTVVVGPEGGFSGHEVRELTAYGAHFASLGELILRTELAAVVALSRVGAWLERRC